MGTTKKAVVQVTNRSPAHAPAWMRYIGFF